MNPFLLKSYGALLNLLSYTAPSYAQSVIFNTFCTPVAPKLQSKQIQYLRKAQYVILDHNGQKIQSYRWGAGPQKVLLVHGWASNSYRWKSLIKKLVEKNYSVYAIDAPAHGLSDGKYLNVHIYEECLSLFNKEVGEFDAVIGHSVGAFTLMYHLFKNENVNPAKTVLLASPGETSDFVYTMQKMLGLNNKSVELLNREANKRIGKTMDFFSASRFYPALKNSLLLIHDSDDIAVDVKHSDQLNKWLEKAEYHRTSGLGHHLRSPEIDEKIVAFLD